jgi:hypothetical protein
VKSVCPDGYQSDGNGACIPIVVTLIACASGFVTDNQGGCLPLSASVPITSFSCPSGFNNDG